jgi:hypothetical protein
MPRLLVTPDLGDALPDSVTLRSATASAIVMNSRDNPLPAMSPPKSSGVQADTALAQVLGLL